MWKKQMAAAAAVLSAVMLCTACQKAPEPETVPETEQAENTDPTVPSVVKTQRINETDIEIYFADGYTGPDKPDVSAFVPEDEKGTALSLDGGYGYGGGIYFDQLLTLRLDEPIPDDKALKLAYGDEKFEVPYDAYYKYELTADCGIPLKGARSLLKGQESLEKAAEMIDILLKKQPEIAAKMVENGAFFVVYGKGENVYYIPEYRGGYDESMTYVEGFGGTPCSVTEANLWRWTDETAPDPEYTTHYKNESILTHEFSHGIKLLGMDVLEDSSLAEEFQMVYRHAKAAGLWPDSYAISNSDEFFATMATQWFSVMSESKEDDTWDGVRGPINTRKELYNYDPDTYRFFAKIFPYESLPGAWASVPDERVITGLGTEEAPDLTGQESVLPYPEPEEKKPEGEDTVYKIVNHSSGHVADCGATAEGAGLWWDYAEAWPDTVGPMSYYVEPVPGSEPKEEDGKTVREVYFRNKELGYVYAADGKVVTAGNLESEPEEPTVFTVRTDDQNISTISCEDGFWAADGAGDGVPLTLSETGNEWRIEPMTKTKNILFVHHCTAGGSEKGLLASNGETVEIAADPAPEGMQFAGWEASTGTVAEPEAEKTTFTMGEGDAVLRALYK